MYAIGCPSPLFLGLAGLILTLMLTASLTNDERNRQTLQKIVKICAVCGLVLIALWFAYFVIVTLLVYITSA